jgi:hypothetical protein
VACEIPRTGGFGLFQDDALEDAIGAALRQDARGEERIGRLADELAARHGGLVVVSYGEGRGTLAPGAVRDLEVAFRLPTELHPGRRYSGTWPLVNARCRVDFEIEEAVR